MLSQPGEPTLEETVALLEATLESTHDGILVVSLARRIVLFNRRFVEMMRLPADVTARHDPDEMIALVADQLEDPDAILLRSPQLWDDLSGEFLTHLRFKDGRVFERFVAPHCVGPSIVGRVITFHDISQSVRAEQALQQHRAFLEKAQEVAHIGSWVADLDDSDRLGWSHETHRIFGVPIGEFDGRSSTFFAFVHPDDVDRVRAASAAAAAGGKTYDIEHRILRRDGSIRWVHEKADIIRDSTGQALRMIGTVQDVTDRRELEEQLRHVQKLEAIGRLAGGIAHDINNALTAIAGYTELALTVLRPEHPARADVQEIRRAAERAASVTRQLLAFSRKQLLEPRVFDVNESVANLGRMLERLLGDDVRLRTELGHDLPPIHADLGQIEQAVVNLAVNARDAMPNGGDLVLATALEDVTASHPHAATMPSGRYVMLRVTDTGHGMDADTRSRIFEPFFTTKEVGKGTGLGLSMVYGTVKQSGGYIFVDSEPGRGATFRLYFPPASQERQSANLEPRTHESPTQTREPREPVEPREPIELRTILVVEDETPVRQLVTATLSRAGYRVVHTASADEAVAAAAATGRIDLLLTDAMMPGTSGVELARRLRAERPQLPIVIMSGYSEEMLELSDLPGPVHVVRKPFTPSELRQRVGEILPQRAASIPRATIRISESNGRRG